jgi:lipopolysaccharide export system protein LptA
MFVRLIIVSFCFLVSLPAFSQKKVKLKHGDTMRGGKRGADRVDWVIGNVIFTQNQTTIYCDSAEIFRAKNTLQAYGRIKITEGDSVTVTAKSLSYDGNEKVAYLRKDVVFTKLATATLYTDYLNYYRGQNMAKYFNGGKLIDSTNTLTSKKGYYDVNTNLASFKTDVVSFNADYTLHSDTLQYNAKTKIVYFRDSTNIVDKDGQTAIYQSGYYDTNKKKSDLEKGDIETQSYKMTGDKYFLDDFRKFYKAKFNVVMTSKEEKMVIYGDDGDYDKLNGISKVYGNAYVAKIDDAGDTLFLSADTLVSIENKDPRKKRLLAYNHVKIFKTDMQGIADSLVYVPADSTMYMYTDPVLWNEENQMTGDSVRLLIHNKKIDKIYLINNSFVVSQDSLTNFNQIKGKKMVATFKESKISNVVVDGNGESIYFALDEQEIKSDTMVIKIAYTMGMNQIVCSNMKINFKEGKVNNISFYKKPDAKFIPPHEVKEPDTRLKGFIWREEDRPEKEEVVKSKQAAKSKKAGQRPTSQ